MKRLIFLLSLLIEAFCLSAAGTNPFFNIGMRQGLSNEFVNDMTMDSQGFLWVATESGLNRIAGSKCTVFNTRNSDISSDAITGLHYNQAANSVWMNFKNGEIDAFDCKTQTFVHVSHQNGMKKGSVSAVSGASDGGMWIAYHGGDIQHYDVKTRKFTTYPKRLFPKIKNGIRCIADDGNGHLYIGLRMDGMYVYNLRTGKARFYCHNPKDGQSLPGNNVRSVCIDHMCNVWVGTNLGLALMDESTGKFRVFKPQEGTLNAPAGDNIYKIVELGDNCLWIASDVGGISVLALNRYRHPYTEKLSFQHITKENSDLSSNNIRRMLQDSFGNVWIGNYGSGIDFMARSASDFHTLGDQRQPISNVSGIFCDSKGQLWIGQDNIISLYKDGQVADQWDFSRYISNTSATVYAFTEDSRGNIWFGTSDNGVLEFNPHTRQFWHHLYSKGLDVHALCEDRNQCVWIGSESGLYAVRQGRERREDAMNRQMGKSSTCIFSIQEDEYGQLWVGTMGKGVFVFDRNKRLVAHLDEKKGLKSNSVNQIVSDVNGAIWIATYNGLAYIENPLKPRAVRMYDERQGLKDTHVRAICPDRKGNVWVSMFTGIACLDQRRQRFCNYDFQSGVTMGNFVEASTAMTPDGTIYFGSPSGVCYFSSQLLTERKDISQVEIIGCERVGRLSDQFLRRLVSPGEDGVVRLEYDDNTFRICFTVKDFSQKGKVEYSYMMKGLDNQWFETESDNDVTFRNLKPGSYTFIIRAKQKNQDWDEASVAELKVVVKPPFWLAWWAKLCYAIAASCIVLCLLRSYKKELMLRNSLAQARWESQRKQEVNEERLRFFTNVTHELRTPLTLILGPLEDMIDDRQLPSQVSRKIRSIYDSAERLLGLVNDILEFRKTETQNRKLCVARADLGRLVRETGVRFLDMNHNPELKIMMEIQDGVSEMYFDAEVITTIVNNLMSNAIKYTPSGRVVLSLKEQNTGFVTISVEDTGYGIGQEALPHICDRYYQENGKHQASGTGIGLALVKSLAQLHEAELKIESEKGKGSRFCIVLRKDNTYPEALHKDAADDTDVCGGTLRMEEKEEAQEGRRPLLLIVEDNVDIQCYIEESLREDYRILKACNGTEGRSVAMEQMPDIIVSDIMMPGMDGMEMMKMLKADIRTCHIPVILLTAKTSTDDQLEGYDGGADSYLTKPFSAKLLRSRIRNILEGRRRLAEYVSQQKTPPVQQKGQESPAMKLSRLDQEFLKKLNDIIETHISTDNLDIAFMTDRMAMSHSTFYRKVKALTGMSANEYIRKAKLRKSMKLIQTGEYSISEVAALTGFNNLGNFRESFRREFGMNPSEVKGGYDYQP